MPRSIARDANACRIAWNDTPSARPSSQHRRNLVPARVGRAQRSGGLRRSTFSKPRPLPAHVQLARAKIRRQRRLRNCLVKRRRDRGISSAERKDSRRSSHSCSKEIAAMRKLPLFLALALAVPSLALAAKPPALGNSQGSHGKAPQVMYVLKGTLTAFTAAAGATNGSVSLLVNSANHHGASLKGQ